MFDRLKVMDEHYVSIQKKLASGKLEVKEMTELLKESSSMSEAIQAYRLFRAKEEELNDLKELVELDSDAEIIEMANMEISEIEDEMDRITEQLKILLIPKDPNDGKNVMFEIKGAAGGDEGNLFAGDLFRMYSRYSENMGWKIEVLDASEGSMGGYTSIEFSVSGKKAYSYLQHESGTHRVQRVPQTESQGRIHTSTATVLVMPEADEIDFDVSWNDIKMDVFRSSGAGGQHVNTTDSAVRLTYLPTGLSVESQLGKSQHENRATAFRILKTRLYDNIIKEQLDKEAKARQSLVGRGDRSEKVRTYNYPQNRITDHRIGLTVKRLDVIIDGRLDLILDPLINEYQKQQLLGEE